MKGLKTDPYSYSLRLISIRDITESELRKRLEKRGYTESEIESTVKRLKERELLDDSRFIKRAENIAEYKLFGRAGVKHYLLRRGVSRELVEEIPDIDEKALAQKLINRKEHLLKGLPEEKRKAKIVSLLMRRGFSSDTIYWMLKTNESLENKIKEDFDEVSGSLSDYPNSS